MAIIDTSSLLLVQVPVQGRAGGKFGLLAVPFLLTWPTQNNQYTLNLQNFVDLNKIDCVRTIWIDNTNNNVAVNVVFSGSSQSITMEPGQQGYVETISPNPISMVFTSVGATGTTQIQLLNFTVASAVFPGASLGQGKSTTFNLANAGDFIFGDTFFTVPGSGFVMVNLSGYAEVLSTNGVGTITQSIIWTSPTAVNSFLLAFPTLPNPLSTVQFPSNVISLLCLGGTSIFVGGTAHGVTNTLLRYTIVGQRLWP